MTSINPAQKQQLRSADGAAISIRLIGPFSVEAAGQPVTISSKRAKALIAYLARRNGTEVARSVLAGLLWGERSGEQARASLRQTLSEIRIAFGPSATQPIAAKGESLCWVKEAAWVDTHVIADAARSGEPRALAAVAPLLRGDFLEGLEIGEASFDYWLSSERQQLRVFAANILIRLMQQATVLGAHEEAISTGLKLISLDPLQEDIHRELMKLYRLQGRTDAALAQFERCKHELKAQLNVAPDAQTEELARSIKSERRHTAPKTPAPAAEVKRVPPQLQITQTQSNRLTIAVLPFANLSADQTQQYFADGIAEDIINALSSIRELFVISRSSTLAFKENPVGAKQAALDLNVQFILEGTIRVAGNKVRVTAQLIDGSSGQALWAERYERELTDIFAVQDEITQNICLALQIKLTQGESARIWEGQTKNLRAWEKLVLARELFHRFTTEDNARSSQFLKEALDIDPDYAIARIHLGIRYYWDARYSPSVDKQSYLQMAEEQADKVSSLNPSMGSAYILKAAIALTRGQHDEAVRLGEYAVSLMPSDSLSLIYLSQMYLYRGDIQKAVDVIRTAMRLSPRPLNAIVFFYALALLWLGEFEKAQLAAEDYLQREPDEPYGYVCMALVTGFLGETEQASAVITRLREAVPWFTLQHVIGSQCYRDPSKTEKVISTLKSAGLK